MCRIMRFLCVLIAATCSLAAALSGDNPATGFSGDADVIRVLVVAGEGVELGRAVQLASDHVNSRNNSLDGQQLQIRVECAYIQVSCYKLFRKVTKRLECLSMTPCMQLVYCDQFTAGL